MQQLQEAPKAAQEEARGTSGYSWCFQVWGPFEHCFKCTHPCADAPFSFPFGKRARSKYSSTHMRCLLFGSLLFYFNWPIHHQLPALLSPKMPLASGHNKGPSGSNLPDEKHIFIFTFSERQREKQISQLKKKCSWHYKKSNMLLHASRFTCPQPCTPVGLWSGSQAQHAAFT